MELSKFKQNQFDGAIPKFELQGDTDVLTDRASQDKYEEYRRKYKEVMGVYPELDKIHFPVCAVPTNKVWLANNLKKLAKKNALAGAGQIFANAVKEVGILGSASSVINTGDDNIASAFSCAMGYQLISPFETEFEYVIHKYKYAYSLMSSLDLKKLSKQIEHLDEVECLRGDGEYQLGFRKNADGVYAEGTWKDGNLVYGLMCIPKNEENDDPLDDEQEDVKPKNDSPNIVAFIGTFTDEGIDEGVVYDGSLFEIGTFKDFKLECEHGVKIEVNDDEFAYIIAVGKYENGNKNGDFIQYQQTYKGQVYIYDIKYSSNIKVKRSFKERNRREKENFPLINRLGQLYVGGAFAVAGVLALTGVFGDDPSITLPCAAVTFGIAAFWIWLFVDTQKAVNKKKKERELMKKEIKETRSR